MSRHTVVIRGGDEGFTAEFSNKDLDVQTEGVTLSEALMKLAEELALHEEQSAGTEDVEAATARYEYMN